MNYLPQFFPPFWTIDYQVFGIPFTNDISIGFVTRTDGGYSFLQIDEFVELKVDARDLLDRAIKNLETEFEDCEIKQYKISGGSLVFWNSENDNFTAVRILSSKYSTILTRIFGDDFNFSIPDRDLISCWKTDNDNENSKLARETTEDYNESEYRLSDKVHTYNGTELRR